MNLLILLLYYTKTKYKSRGQILYPLGVGVNPSRSEQRKERNKWTEDKEGPREETWYTTKQGPTPKDLKVRDYTVGDRDTPMILIQF